VLTMGSYSSRAQAEKAAKSLPKGMTPWIRNMGSVQQVMKREAKAAAKADVSFPPTGAGIKDTAWVWSQDPGRYTIQLAAAESEQAIEAAMRRIALPMVGGMITTTLLTLIVIPVVYYLWESRKLDREVK